MGPAALAALAPPTRTGTRLTWTLSEYDSGRFDISSTGQVSFKQPPDYEDPQDGGTDNVYRFTLSATAGGDSVSMVVWVAVTDVNEPPGITDTQTDFSHTEENAHDPGPRLCGH